MKKILLVSLLGLTTLIASAQSNPATDTITVPAPSLKIEVPEHLRRMDSDEFYVYKGAYDLSNGKVLTLSQRGSQMYAEVEDEGMHRIVATAANAFVALDRQLQMKIDIHDDGSVDGELLMVVPAKQLADGSYSQARLVRLATR